MSDGLDEAEIKFVNELVKVLRDQIQNINVLCNVAEKSKIRAETETKVEKANKEVSIFVEETDKDILEIEKEIKELNDDLDEILQTTTQAVSVSNTFTATLPSTTHATSVPATSLSIETSDIISTAAPTTVAPTTAAPTTAAPTTAAQTTKAPTTGKI